MSQFLGEFIMRFDSSLLQFYAYLHGQGFDADFDVRTLFRNSISEKEIAEARSELKSKLPEIIKENTRQARLKHFDKSGAEKVSAESSASAAQDVLDEDDFARFCDSLEKGIKDQPDAPGCLPVIRVGMAHLLKLLESSQKSSHESSENPPSEVLVSKLKNLFSSFVSLSVAEAEAWYETEEVQDCMGKSLPIYRALSRPLIAVYQGQLESLGDIAHPEGLIPLFAKSWMGSCVKMAASLLWMLEKKVSPEKIISSGILDQFFLYYSSEEAVLPFYKLLQEYEKAEPLVRRVDQTFIPSYKAQPVFSGHALETRLTGQREPIYSTSTELFPQLLREEVSLTLPAEHHAETYEALFGEEYWFSLIAYYQKEPIEAIQRILKKKLNVDELAGPDALKQLNAFILALSRQDNKSTLLKIVAGLLGDDTAEKLIQGQHNAVFLLTPYKSFLQHKLSVENATYLIDSITRGQESDLDKITMLQTLFFALNALNQSHRSLEIQALFLGALLDLMLKNNSHGFDEIKFRLSKFVQLPLLERVVNDKVAVLVVELDKVIGEMGASISEDTIHAIKDCWDELRDQYSILHSILPEHSFTFPENKFSLYAYLVKQLLVKSVAFDVGELLQWCCPYEPTAAGGVSDYERLVIELICSLDDCSLYKELCDLMERAPINRAAADWRNKLYGDKSLFILAAERGGVAFVSEVLSGDNQPSKAAVKNAFVSAASEGQLVIVEKLLGLTGNNKPTQAAVELALLHAVGSRQWTIVKKMISLTGANKPSQALVEEVLAGVINLEQWMLVERIIGMTGDNKPSQAVVEKVLANAINSEQWMLVERIIGMTGDNKPSQAVVEKVLANAINSEQWTLVKKIISLTGDNKLNQAVVEEVLAKVINLEQWTVVENILSLNGDNKPSQAVVEKVLAKVINLEQCTVVERILSLSGDNKPSEVAVEMGLGVAGFEGRWEVVEKILSLSGGNKAYQEMVGRALVAAADSKQWTVVEKLLGLTGDNKSSQEAVRLAFVVASCCGERAIVEKIINMTGVNKPDQEVMVQALKGASLSEAWGVVEKLLGLMELDKHILDVLKVALSNAGYSGQWHVVDRLLELRHSNGLNSEALQNILEDAARLGHVGVVEKLLGLTGDNWPNSVAVGRALEAAVDSGKLAIVVRILDVRVDNWPNLVVVGRALEAAVDSGEWAIVVRILDVFGNNQPNKILINRAIKAWKNAHPKLLLDEDGNSALHQKVLSPPFDLEDFNYSLSCILTTKLHKYCTQKNHAGLTPIHLLYRQCVENEFSDKELKESNLSGLLYELALKFKSDNKDIKRVLLSLAHEGKQPEAWMALAMLARSEKQNDLQEKYIEYLERDSQFIKRSCIFFRSISPEKVLCEALLRCDASLIQRRNDPRHVANFIKKYDKELRLVCGLESPDNELKNDPPVA